MEATVTHSHTAGTHRWQVSALALPNGETLWAYVHRGPYGRMLERVATTDRMTVLNAWADAVMAACRTTTHTERTEAKFAARDARDAARSELKAAKRRAMAANHQDMRTRPADRHLSR